MFPIVHPKEVSYLLYCSYWIPIHPKRYFIIFSNDTALLKLLFNGEIGHDPVLEFVFLLECKKHQKYVYLL